MKNKRAFTLIELLAVIVIMGILLTITIPQLIKNLKDKKDVALETIKETIVSIGKNYAIDNNIEAPFYISINDLCTEKYLECPVINPATNSDLAGYVIMDLNNIYYFSYTIPNISNLIVNLNDGQLEQRLLSEYFAGTKLSLNIPAKEGYTFTGWTVEGEGASLSENILTIGTSATTITANWQRNTVTLTVNLNEGSTTQSFEETYYSLSTLSLINPTKAGYTFTGWTVEGTGASISGTELTIGTSDTTITANWEEELVNPLLSYSCENASEGSSPYILTYTGNCTVIDDGDGNWRVKFLTSGDLTMSSTTIIDAFLVGGGGGGGYTGGGGGGGYTTTAKTITLTAGTAYSISIGVGGAGQAAAASGGKGADGGASSAFNKSAAGGKGGKGDSYTNHSRAGGDGGSGGGSYDNTINISGVGGSDGGDGGIGRGGLAGGVGQGTTTREFGESSGALYAGGGGAACYNPSSGAGTGAAGGGGGGGTGGRSSHYIGSEGEVNTGGGGGGMYNGAGMAGGSGIVIIRNAR